MRVLVACESSGKVRDQFLARGHNAVSCDLLPTKSPGPHHQGDVREILGDRWDMVVAFPTCTYVCGSSIHWVKRGRVEADGRPRAEHMAEGIAFARMFIDGPETAHIRRRVVENPVGVLSTAVRKPDQIVHPYMFGDDASKATCLWLHGVDPLEVDPALFVPPRLVVWEGKWVMRWANQTDSGQNNLPPSDDRWDLRSETYDGIAEAMGRGLAKCWWRTSCEHAKNCEHAEKCVQEFASWQSHTPTQPHMWPTCGSHKPHTPTPPL